MNALAMVVGNSDYTLNEFKLNNAKNDADSIALKLEDLGFIVIKCTNCNNEGFDRALREFSEKLKNFDVGLFYFAGHGLQVEGCNYLTQIDTQFTDEISVKHSSPNIDEVIERMQKADPKVKIIILDACRNNPFTQTPRGGTQGLAPIYAPRGTIIAFSTSPGQTASDIGCGENSVYTGALLNHLSDPTISKIPIEDFFKRVRTTVFNLSKEKQTSWEHTSLIGNFYFDKKIITHSIKIQYPIDYVADENFVVNEENAIDKLISKFKSYNWYKQEEAFNEFSKVKPNDIAQEKLFLIGRNILQSAIGKERTATTMFKRSLESWLSKYFVDEENHVLNGILYEIYFNSKGLFRKNSFKVGFIDEIFNLAQNPKFKKSFEFISQQLSPFSGYLPFIPSITPNSVSIDVILEETSTESARNSYKLKSIKWGYCELLHITDSESHTRKTEEYLLDEIQKQLCIPTNMLHVNFNVNNGDIGIILIPWEFQIYIQ